MRRGRSWLGGLAAVGILAAAGCGGSKNSRYRSPFGDFVGDVPTGWTPVVDSAGRDYYQITFVGPFDPAFFKGVPSLSVRWYRFNRPHRLPDGGYEM
jgi:hypothetical protein